MKTKKRFLSGLCTLALAVTLAFGAFAYLPAKADTTETPYIMLTNVQIDPTVSYGDNIVVPDKSAEGAEVAVVTPGGKTVTLPAVNADGNYVVLANELGHYTVTYTSSTNATYSFSVYCSLDEELELVVENEAAIPTYVKTAGKATFPAAKVGYYDEDGEFVEVDATVTAKTDAGETVAIGEEFTFVNEGSTFVTYSAQVEGGTKYVSKTYEVKVQDDFADTKAPTLSISGVPSTGNTNMAVTLPVASASDTFDSKVKVNVTVQGKDADGNLVDVPAVETDDNDYAVATLEAKEVFDNDKNMTFYPTKNGDYKVKYQAVDDSGNTSAEWVYTITVSDKKAPVITVDETVTPSKWGTKVKKLAANGTDLEDVADAKLMFPFPEFYDNADAAADVTIGFTVKDPAGKNVIKFSNINGAVDAEGTTTGSDFIADKTYAFNNTMDAFGLDIVEYVTERKKTDSAYTVYGDYVATYTAEDAAGNRATKTVTVNVAETFEDDSEVEVEITTLDKYVKLSANKAVEFTVPTPKYSSTVDAKLALAYDVYGKNGAALGATLKGGEEVTIAIEEGKAVLSYEDKSVELDGKIVLKATATSDAGNTTTAEAEVKVLSPAATAMFNAANILAEVDTTTPRFNNESKHVLGDITVSGIDAANKKYVGIELGAKDSDGNYVDVSAEVYFAKDTLVARNVSFKTQKAGVYALEFRVFDINGHSFVAATQVEIQAVTQPDFTNPASAVDFTTAAVNTKLLLKNETLNPTELGKYLTEGEDYDANGVKTDKAYAVVSHTIEGGRFAIMGEELTALQTGKYSVKDNYVLADATSLTSDYKASNTALTNYLASVSKYSEFDVNDNSTVAFELQGVMPNYTSIDTTEDKNVVALPKATAFTTNANASKIVLKVTDPSGSTVTPYYVEGENKVNLASTGIIDASKDYKFAATANGTYTVTYTAYVDGASEKTFSYTIKAGDVIAPTFKLTNASGNDASHDTAVKSGYSFKFLAMAATDNKDGASDITYTKKIVGPDGEVVGGTISGKGTTYANKELPASGEITLDASGKYIVTYTVTDAAGNDYTQEYEITVTNSSSNKGISLATLSTILIIVGVLLIAGVVVYLFRFRRVKKG